MITFYLWVLAIGFCTGETAYFGWNAFPQSDAELICDGISAILAAIALLSTCVAQSQKREV